MNGEVCSRIYYSLLNTYIHFVNVCLSTGNYATVVAHNPETKKTRVRLPSGAKKVLDSSNRAMIGIFYLKLIKIFMCFVGICISSI